MICTKAQAKAAGTELSPAQEEGAWRHDPLHFCRLKLNDDERFRHLGGRQPDRHETSTPEFSELRA